MVTVATEVPVKAMVTVATEVPVMVALLALVVPVPGVPIAANKMVIQISVRNLILRPK